MISIIAWVKDWCSLVRRSRLESEVRRLNSQHAEIISRLKEENERLEMEKLNAISKCHAITTTIERNGYSERGPMFRVVVTIDGRLLDALEWGNDQYFIDAVGHHTGREVAHKITQANRFRTNQIGISPRWMSP